MIGKMTDLTDALIEAAKKKIKEQEDEKSKKEPSGKKEPIEINPELRPNGSGHHGNGQSDLTGNTKLSML